MRSKHAHKKSKQIYIPLQGSIKVLVNKEKKIYFKEVKNWSVCS